MTKAVEEGRISILSGLEPAIVWRMFDAVRSIPRPSGSEQEMTRFLCGFASERGLAHLTDAVGNVLVKLPGRGPASSGRPVCIQAHTDMVAEKLDSSSHDFLRDPIDVEVDGDWVVSRETTLGADNGMGVAIMLALLDGGCESHPPLECLFTIDEERGLTGASHLDPGWLEARRMINLDSEEEGHFCIGCAGGVDVGIEGRFTPVPAPRGFVPLSVRVEGLLGGHSGMEIHSGRANAIRVLGRVLRTLIDGHRCAVASMAGGSKRNAIPRTASALVAAPRDGLEGIREAAAAIQARQREEFSPVDGDVTIAVTASTTTGDALPDSVMPPEFASRAVDLLLSLHHGVERMSCLSKGLVETSCNLAILESGVDSVSLVLTARSLVETAKYALVDRLDASARLAGFSHSRGNGYPGWKPDASSELLAAATAHHRGLTGGEPLVEAVHAGLECGIIGDRVGGMDMISMGPDIRGVHAPGERVCISSTGRFWEFLRGLLARL